jgi:hypothetical protein
MILFAIMFPMAIVAVLLTNMVESENEKVFWMGIIGTVVFLFLIPFYLTWILNC